MASDFGHDFDTAALSASEIKGARPIFEVHEKKIVDLLVRPKGRPAVDPTYHKKAVSIRLDSDVIAYFKSAGPGWQTRLNDFLRDRIGEPKAR
jgi:uncharacterized protein (DUF4415 family)